MPNMEFNILPNVAYFIIDNRYLLEIKEDGGNYYFDNIKLCSAQVRQLFSTEYLMTKTVHIHPSQAQFWKTRLQYDEHRELPFLTASVQLTTSVQLTARTTTITFFHTTRNTTLAH